MPRKSRPSKLVKRNFPSEAVWVAPRPANPSKPRAFEPVGMAQSNRYLEFADIAFGAKKSSPPRKKQLNNTPSQAQKQPAQDHHNFEGKVTSINSRTRKPRGMNQGFGVFRNTR